MTMTLCVMKVVTPCGWESTLKIRINLYRVPRFGRLGEYLPRLLGTKQVFDLTIVDTRPIYSVPGVTPIRTVFDRTEYRKLERYILNYLLKNRYKPLHMELTK